MIKVIEQENRYNIEVGLYGSCDVIILTHGNDLYRSGISIEKSKAREVALAICPELASELAEKDKEIERFAIEFAEWFTKNTGKYTDDILALRQGKYIELYKQSLNK